MCATSQLLNIEMLLDYNSDSSNDPNAGDGASDAFKIAKLSAAKRPRIEEKALVVSAAPDVLSEVGRPRLSGFHMS